MVTRSDNRLAPARSAPPRVTARQLRARKARAGKPRVAALTAYDATFARLFDDAGVDLLLVGDSLGMVVQGGQDTLAVTLEDIVYHTRAVARAASRALVVADLPFMTYHLSAQQALASAGVAVQKGGAQAVKLEGGGRVAEAVARIVEAGIPVMGHLGMTPQSVHAFGGFRVQAKAQPAAERLLEEARRLEAAGAFSIVLEAIPRDLAARVTHELSIPTIGIGAGSECDGQVLVMHDILGLLPDFQPRFARVYASLAGVVVSAAEGYVADVQSGDFPNESESYSAGAKKPSAAKVD